MKNPVLQIAKSAVIVCITIMIVVTGNLFGQSDTLWQSGGSDSVLTNKHVKINNTLDVYGKATVDDLHIHGTLQIGDSSFYLKDNVPVSPYSVDQIRSSGGRIALMRGGNAINDYNSDILVGIGTSKPQSKLDVLGGAAFGTYAGVTAAPANSIIVSGNMGLGVTNPGAKLELNYNSTGNLKIGDGNRAILGGNSAGNLHIDAAPFPGKIYLNHYEAGNVIMATGGGNIGMGTLTPQSKLDVEGGVSIGANYSGSIAAQPDGAIIQGNVGIGTNAPVSKLDVEGGVSIGAAYSGSNAAPPNGAIIQGNVGIGTIVSSND